MPISLANADVLTVPDLQKGIIETIIDEDGELLARMPWEPVEGKSFDYTRESTLPDVDWRSVNELIPHTSAPVPVNVSVTLKIINGDSDLDKFLRDTKSDVNDLNAYYVEAAAKALRRFILDAVIYGDAAAAAKQFSGLHKLTSAASPDMIVAPGGALALAAHLDVAIDSVKPGKPDIIICNRAMRRRFSQAARTSAVAGNIWYEPNEFGRRQLVYDSIPIVVNDYITMTETDADNPAKTGGTATSIFLVKFGSVLQGGVSGLIHAGLFQHEIIDPVPDADAIRHRVKAYIAMAIGNLYSLAKIRGVTDAAFTA